MYWSDHSFAYSEIFRHTILKKTKTIPYEGVMFMQLLAEQLFMLAIDPKTNKPYARTTTSLPYSLAGALLADLMLHAYVEVQEKKIVILQKDAEDPLLNETLALMNEKKPKSAKHWVSSLPSTYKNMPFKIGEKLDQSSYLTLKEKRVFGLFPSYSYHFEQGNLLELVQNRFSEVIAKTEQNEALNKEDERVVTLLSLVHSSQLIHIIFPDRKQATDIEKQIKRLTHDLPVSKAVKVTTDTIHASLGVALTTAVISSSSSSDS